MLVRVERTDYLTTWARFRGALVRLIRIIASDQLVDVRPRRRRRHSRCYKIGHRNRALGILRARK